MFPSFLQAWTGEYLKGALLAARGVAFLVGFGNFFILPDIGATLYREAMAYRAGASAWQTLIPNR